MINEISNHALDYALKSADQAEVYVEISEGVDASIQNDQVDFAKESYSMGMAIRVICEGKMGFAYTTQNERIEETVKKAIEPALEYLRELNQYLWNEGKTFPATLAQMDQMFADGELVMSMSCYPYTIASQIENGIYPETAVSFQFENGMTADTDYIGVAANSPNKQAALVVMNEILSPEMQAARYEDVKIVPVMDFNKLSDAERDLFDSVDIGKGIIPLEELNENKLPQLSAKLIPIVEEIWLEEVVGK